MSDNTKKWIVRVPDDLAEVVDKRVALVGVSRNEWLLRVLRWATEQSVHTTLREEKA